MTDQVPFDYFLYAGYRKMMLSVLKQAAADLLLPPGTKKNDAIIASVKNWVQFSPAEVLSSAAGLTFANCIQALGEASCIDDYRKGFLDRPADALKAASQAIDAINASEGIFQDTKTSRQPELLTTGHLDASWLHMQVRG